MKSTCVLALCLVALVVAPLARSHPLVTQFTEDSFRQWLDNPKVTKWVVVVYSSDEPYHFLGELADYGATEMEGWLKVGSLDATQYTDLAMELQPSQMPYVFMATPKGRTYEYTGRLRVRNIVPWIKGGYHGVKRVDGTHSHYSVHPHHDEL